MVPPGTRPVFVVVQPWNTVNAVVANTVVKRTFLKRVMV
jgi:hypothetical protein